jgi:adenylyltransferase/sulfurtransferase
LGELEGRLAELESCRDKEIVAMCHHGVRSGMAQGLLTEKGFTWVRNLVGGIDAYAATVDPGVGFY